MDERMDIPKFTNTLGAAELAAALGHEFAVVQNPSYVHPAYELYPLPDKRTELSDGMVGAVMDMDGTTTTTEPLCIHSLETMVRRITNHEGDPAWPGLNRKRDLPHIIGNSTTKHVEYLVRTYGADIDDAAFRLFYLYSAIWTIGKAADPGRRAEVCANMAALAIEDALDDPRFQELAAADSLDTPEARRGVRALTDDFGPRLRLASFADRVRAAVDVYYQRYHFILARIAAGDGESVERDVFGSQGGHLIRPMTGIGVFLAMLKGWLGTDVAFCFDEFRDHLSRLDLASDFDVDAARALLPALGAYFAQRPAAVAVVTSSIRYEADIVLGEVFRVLA
ncbi:MAG: hypothetical protein JXR94_09145, partial [Candidatus Hydrogenedentes bacterium]|nr:hypothetical protein [Candidatus Hydrogenedentota bacterium]